MTSREEVFYGEATSMHQSVYTGGQTARPITEQSSGKQLTSGSSVSTNPSNNSNNNEVNEDIQAFYLAKEQLLKRREQEETKRKAERA